MVMGSSTSFLLIGGELIYIQLKTVTTTATRTTAKPTNVWRIMFVIRQCLQLCPQLHSANANVKKIRILFVFTLSKCES